MLQRIRDRLQSQKWLAIVLLGALALVFAAWGAYGIVNVNVGGSDYAAKAGDQKISVDQARNAWMREQSQWQQRFGGDIPPTLRQNLQNELLESLIRRSLIEQRAHDLGYRVSDAQIAEAIRTEPAFQVEGKYSADAAKAALAQAGIALPAFEADLRSGLERAQIENGIRATDFLTPRELDRIRALADEQREVRYAVFDPEKLAGNAPIDDAAVSAYYAKNQSSYMNPESVRLQYAELRVDQLAAQISVTDAEARAYYEKNKDRWVIPEKRRAQHILIQVAGGNDAAALKKAGEVLAEAKAGKDFGALAKQYSQDAGSAPQGGELGWTDKSSLSLEAPFADALFGMSVGEIRGPVKTQYGYHIIRLEEIQAGKIQTFEQARQEIDAQVRRDQASDRFGDVQEQLQRKLEEPGANFDALVKEFQLQTGEVAKFERGSGGAPLGTSADLQEAVFATPVLDEGHIGGPVALGDDRIVIFKALAHQKPTPKPIAEVHDVIVAAIRKERGSVAAQAAAEIARTRLAAGASFDTVMHDLGVTAQPARFIGRVDPAVAANILTAAFNAPKPVGGKPIYRQIRMADGGAAIVAVTAVREQANPANKELDAKHIEDALDKHGSGDFAAYMDEMRRTASVKKNLQAFE